jgi:thiamine-phosphate pyrophosphorylase
MRRAARVGVLSSKAESMAFDGSKLRLCLVTDRALAGGRGVIEVALAAVRGGATMVQLREKDATTRAFVEQARALKAALAPLGVPLAINDRLDVALAVDADGLHVGQDDMPVETARRLLGPDRFIGLSITAVEQVLRPDAEAADYLGVGPIYAQMTKSDAAAPLGVEGLRRLRALTGKPLVAIGGLTPDNSAPVLAAGADGLAVVSAIVGAQEPEAAARRFGAVLGAGGSRQ